MVDSDESLYITSNKKYRTYVKTFVINVTVGNGQKMKFELKVSVNMSTQGEETVDITEVL